jgi:hypothetical protein
MLYRVFLLAGLFGLATNAGCGGCTPGGFDAGVPDATVGGTFTAAWSVVDETTNQPVSCDKIDLNARVSVELTGPVPGGSEAFSCKSLGGMSSTTVPPGTYIVRYQLDVQEGSKTVTVASVTGPSVTIRSGDDVKLAPVTFRVNATGGLQLTLQAGTSGNCVGGAGITGFTISLVHDGGPGDTACEPVVFALSGGGTFDARSCSSPSVQRCVAADETLTVASLPSGPYQIHVAGKKLTTVCWTNNDSFTVPAQGKTATLMLNLALDGGSPSCP